jgi:hypothetical protein
MDYEVNLSSSFDVCWCRSPRQDLVLLFVSSVRSGKVSEGCELDDQRSILDGAKISLLSTASKPSLVPTQGPTQ